MVSSSTNPKIDFFKKSKKSKNVDPPYGLRAEKNRDFLKTFFEKFLWAETSKSQGYLIFVSF